MNRLFRRWLKSKTQGDEEKELWWWKIFYRYEGSIGITIAIILTLIIALIILPFSYLSLGGMIAVGGIFAGVLLAPFVGGAIARIIVSPLYETIGDVRLKKDDVGQGSLLFATILGKIANFLIHWWPLFLIGFCFIDFKWWLFVGICVFAVIYYMILGRVKPNVKDYVNWRFNWAIENYEDLFSGHYKWWTAAASMSEQKYNLKKFQNYKYNAALALIMSPLLAPPTTALFYSYADIDSSHGKNKIEQVQESTDSVSTASDYVENTIEDNNVDDGIIEGAQDNDVVNQNEDMNGNNQVEDSQVDETQFDDTDTPIKEDNQVYSLGDISEKDNPQFPSAGNNGFSHFKLAVMDYLDKQLGGVEKGSIYVDFKIDKKGNVYDIDTSLTHGQDLRKKVYQIFKGLHFIPAKKDGKPIIVQTNISM